MSPERAEKLGSLFMAVFSVGLAAQFASVGMLHGTQWIGAGVASVVSVAFAVAVRVWPRAEAEGEPVPVRVRRDER